MATKLKKCGGKQTWAEPVYKAYIGRTLYFLYPIFSRVIVFAEGVRFKVQHSPSSSRTTHLHSFPSYWRCKMGEENIENPRTIAFQADVYLQRVIRELDEKERKIATDEAKCEQGLKELEVDEQNHKKEFERLRGEFERSVKYMSSLPHLLDYY